MALEDTSGQNANEKRVQELLVKDKDGRRSVEVLLETNLDLGSREYAFYIRVLGITKFG